MNVKCWLFGERTVIFEHLSTVESWYCSTGEHENYFASLFRPLRTTVRPLGWVLICPVICTQATVATITSYYDTTLVVATLCSSSYS
jgi:hypothetical protein